MVKKARNCKKGFLIQKLMYENGFYRDDDTIMRINYGQGQNEI